MPAEREPGAPPPFRPRAPRPAPRRWGLAFTAAGSGLAATLTLAFPLLEALSVALGVAALTSGIGAWMRSTPADTFPRTCACLGAVLGTVALIVAVGRVDRPSSTSTQDSSSTGNDQSTTPTPPTPSTHATTPVIEHRVAAISLENSGLLSGPELRPLFSVPC